MHPIEIKYNELRSRGIRFGSREGKFIELPDTGSKQAFELLTIYHAPNSEMAFEVSGFIREKYESMGEQDSVLGYPVSDAVKDSEVKKGVKQKFQFGWMGWSPVNGVYYCEENASGERGFWGVDVLTRFSKETDFFKKYYDYASLIEKEFRVPALFTIAQSALETGWGKKAPANNMFGVKANKTWTGQKVLVETDEYHPTADIQYPEIISIEYIPALKLYKYRVKDWFRAYDSPLNSFFDRTQFLLKKRYEKAFLYNDPYNFAREIAAAGYATATNYYPMLASIIFKLDAIKTAIQNQMMETGNWMDAEDIA